jgi:hypothetical protein
MFKLGSVFSGASLLVISAAIVQAQPTQPLGPRVPKAQEITVPVPTLTGELANGPIVPATDPSTRASAMAQLTRAFQNEELPVRSLPPFMMKVSFTAAGNAGLTGSGTMTEYWVDALHWKWTVQLGEVTVTQQGSNHQVGGTQPSATVPSRIQMLRSMVTYATQIPGPNTTIRTSMAQQNGASLTCLLSSKLPPASVSTRQWPEEERCMDNATGLLTVFSVAPGVYTNFGYTRNQQFHGRTIPDRITTMINGTVVLDAQVSVSDLGSIDRSFFANTPEMLGKATSLSLWTRFPMSVPDSSGKIRPVIVHATIDMLGNATDVELCAAADPTLAQTALDLVKKTNYGPNGLQRDAYINVQFGTLD